MQATPEKPASPHALTRYAGLSGGLLAPDHPGNASGQQSTNQSHSEGQRRGTTEGRQSGQRRVRLAEGQASPWEPAERRSAAQCFLGHPCQRHDERPHPGVAGRRRTALEQGADETEHRDVQRLEDSQRDPWERPDVDTRP